MVRVMNLQRQARSNVLPTGPDKMPPAKQLVEIRRRVGELLDEAEELWLKDLKPALEKKDVHFITYDELTGVRRQMVDKYFETEILPVLTPQGVDAGRPFPMISSRSINFVIELRSTDPSDEKSYFARLKNPNNVPRFLFVPKDLTGEETIDFASGDGDILMMEDLVANRMGMLFPGYKVKNYGMFRVTRNTDGEIEEDEADDLARGRARLRRTAPLRLHCARGTGPRHAACASGLPDQSSGRSSVSGGAPEDAACLQRLHALDEDRQARAEVPAVPCQHA